MPGLVKHAQAPPLTSQRVNESTQALHNNSTISLACQQTIQSSCILSSHNLMLLAASLQWFEPADEGLSVHSAGSKLLLLSFRALFIFMKQMKGNMHFVSVFYPAAVATDLFRLDCLMFLFRMYIVSAKDHAARAVSGQTRGITCACPLAPPPPFAFALSA